GATPCGSRPTFVTVTTAVRVVPSAVGPTNSDLGFVCSTGPKPVPVIASVPGPPSDAASDACALWAPRLRGRKRAVPGAVSPGASVRGRGEPSSEAVRSALPAKVNDWTTSGLLLMLVTVNGCAASPPRRTFPNSSAGGRTARSVSTPVPVSVICFGAQVGQGVIWTAELKAPRRSGRNRIRTTI